MSVIRMPSAAVALVVAVTQFTTLTTALDNGAAVLPPMGFSTWNKVRCEFNATLLLEIADAMVSSGMVDAGYTSFNIDDCWPVKDSRSPSGEIIPDPAKFPDGMEAFSSALTSRGLGFGIYTAHGPKTCQGYPGSLGYETIDAQTYVKWNVSYVKNDWCWRLPNITTEMHLKAFNTMRDALNATGKSIVHSIHWNTQGAACPTNNASGGNVDCPMADTANMWRIGGDIRPNWEQGILRLIDIDTNFSDAAGPGHWNDADMLEVGNGMSDMQDRGHFTMWCMLNSPLIAGNDPRTMSEATRNILTNKHAIAINQDLMAQQAELDTSSSDETGQVWVKPLAEPMGAIAVAFLNRGPNIIILNWTIPTSTSYTALDLWDDAKPIGTVTGTMAVSVNGTTASMYKLVPS